MSRIVELKNTMPQVGRVEWIGLRLERKGEVQSVGRVRAVAGKGLDGDRFTGRGSLDREVTLIQAEHLPVIASLSARDRVRPETLRRNIAVLGINLWAMRDRRFAIGEATFVGTGTCDPCARMEAALGPGGFNAMRGHGGITCRIETGGWIQLGDHVSFLG